MTWRPVETMSEAGVTKATNVVAVGGITMPAWYVHLEAASTVAATFVPILSALWLIVQIARTLFRRKEAPK